MVVWAWAALPGFVSALVSWSLAVLVLRTRPDRFQNRLLAAFLLTTGTAWFLNQGLATITDDASRSGHLMLWFLFVHHLAHLFHFLFVTTLPTPLVRPLRHPVARGVVFVLWSVSVVDLVRNPGLWVTGAVPAVSEGAFLPLLGPRMGVASPVWLAFFLLGLVAAIDAFRRAPAGPLRKQTGAYLVAFAGHDGGLMLWNVWFGLAGATASQVTVERMIHWVPPIVNIWMVAWLSYGILRMQLFDIDLKIRWAVERSGLVTFVVVVFWFITEAIEQTLPVEGTLPALMGAAALALVFRPIQRAAQRLAERLMPGAKDGPDYRRDRMLEVYRATLQGALQDGVVTERESQILASLRTELGLDDVQAAAIEAELGDATA